MKKQINQHTSVKILLPTNGVMSIFFQTHLRYVHIWNMINTFKNIRYLNRVDYVLYLHFVIEYIIHLSLE